MFERERGNRVEGIGTDRRGCIKISLATLVHLRKLLVKLHSSRAASLEGVGCVGCSK